MSLLPPALTPQRAKHTAVGVMCSAAVAGAAILAVSDGGCSQGPAGLSELRAARRLYPPSPQPPRVVSLGNLRHGPGPGEAEVKLSLFLFGAEPQPPLGFVRPVAVAADDAGLIVCDGGLAAVLRWDAAEGTLLDAALSPPPPWPVAVCVASNGDRLVADTRRGAVLRYAPNGAQIREYVLPRSGDKHSSTADIAVAPDTADTAVAPGGVVEIAGEVWITNTLVHRIDVFDAATGRPLRVLGRRGAGPGEFGYPTALAATPDGNVCVVDMLNNRVQVLAGDGGFVRAVGGPGDVPGRFGRPRGVAVGPDGTIFVTDASSQRVHAFDANGRALLAFGAPDDPVGALSMPNGICITRQAPVTNAELPAGFSAQFFVCVAEQLLRPGIRVYAWGEAEEPDGRAEEQGLLPANAHVMSPHWAPQRCNACHAAGMEHKPGDAKARWVMDRGAVDELCVSCHDGQSAWAEAHPIGRPANTDAVHVPDEWPTVDGRIGCLTCHDVKRHCRPGVRRPRENPAMLRFFDPEDSMAVCFRCHKAEAGWRFNPHHQIAGDGTIREETCTYCHTRVPAIPADGRRGHDPSLYIASSDLCQTCHVRHWDFSPQGHLDRLVPASMIRALYESGRENHPNGDPPAALGRLPLADGRVACYSCHNPHQRGLFPSDSALGLFADDPADAAVSLRMDTVDLCLECHVK